MRIRDLVNDGIHPEFIVEHAVAKPGDWDGASTILKSISEFVFSRNWKVVGKATFNNADYTVARLDGSTLAGSAAVRLVAGEMLLMKDGTEVKLRFAVVFEIELSIEQTLGSKLGIPDLHSVFAVAVHPDLHGFGIARTMYKWLLKCQGITILGDRTQYFGARRLWAVLSKQTDVTVDIVDVKAVQVLERGVALHHGRYDHDFDSRVWSYGRDLEHVRLVLRDVA